MEYLSQYCLLPSDKIEDAKRNGAQMVNDMNGWIPLSQRRLKRTDEYKEFKDYIDDNLPWLGRVRGLLGDMPESMQEYRKKHNMFESLNVLSKVFGREWQPKYIWNQYYSVRTPDEFIADRYIDRAHKRQFKENNPELVQQRAAQVAERMQKHAFIKMRKRKKEKINGDWTVVKHMDTTLDWVDALGKIGITRTR